MVVQTAQKYIGYLEHLDNDLLGVYTANTGKGGCTIFAQIIAKHYRWRNFQGIPWCATFVHAVFIEAYGREQARKMLGKPHPGTRVMARRMKRKGWLRNRGYSPKAGDLIFLHNGDGEIGHCGVVASTEGDTVISIEGNTIDPTGHFSKEQGGAVAVRKRNQSDPAIVCYAALSNL